MPESAAARFNARPGSYVRATRFDVFHDEPDGWNRIIGTVQVRSHEWEAFGQVGQSLGCHPTLEHAQHAVWEQFQRQQRAISEECGEVVARACASDSEPHATCPECGQRVPTCGGAIEPHTVMAITPFSEHSQEVGCAGTWTPSGKVKPQ